jgi:hypothetical protein
MELHNLDNSTNKNSANILQDPTFANLLKSNFKLKGPFILRSNSKQEKISDLLTAVKNNLK